MVLDIVGVAITFLAVGIGAWFIGPYLHRVFTGQRVFLSPVVRPVERGFYWLGGIKEDGEQTWVRYLVAMLVVQVVSLLFSYVIFRVQNHLPLNPMGFSPVAPDLALNTAISFTTNTNWQNYTGEQTMSYLSQMLGLVIHNFLSAATGIALAVALVRAIASRSLRTIGNFYVDATRAILYVLLPISIVGALILASQGVIQTLASYPVAHTLEGIQQSIAVGPFASQEVIKDLGNNGGGPFNANSAHPFENPNGFTNNFEIFLELWIPFGLAVMFGHWVGNVKQGLAIGGAMALVLVGATGIAAGAEQVGNPALTNVGVSQANTSTQAGGNMEGKAVRFGPIYSAEFAASTTGTSTGSVDSSHDSFTPIGGMVPMVLIQLGEITPGGVGAGLYGMLMFAVIAVFIAGLMVGRTPEYLGKKIESREVRMAVLTLLAGPAVILGFTALSVLLPAGKAGPLNPAAHGFSEILYSFTSQFGNNGSAFAGLTGNTVYYNSMGGAAMWLGRYIFVIPLLALAGSLAGKKVVPAGKGTFATDTPLFAGLLVGVILIVGALTFFPALSLGPLLEHFQLAAGQLAH
ncbi:MAG TPA: potassium-transporting ATPase subunit KdpA [Candidatus Dormibacteraeota bacterium]|nr:potassium-transporting ATPase subunit KdpA [Candidatus Dormibacteraeota bacterium]